MSEQENLATTTTTKPPLLDPIRTGTFLGTKVHSGRGGGLASRAAIAKANTTHFHAARLPEFGDVVLAVTRTFDEHTGAALLIELRAFGALAPQRGALAEMPVDQLMNTQGAIAYARVVLSSPGDEADERRPAILECCVVTDAAPTAQAASGVATWLRTTWETELSFASWPAVCGSLSAFSLTATSSADWSREWLLDSEHHIDEDKNDFIKVLAPTWLDPEPESKTTAEPEAKEATTSS